MSKLKVLFFLSGTRNKASSRVRGFWVTEELSRLDVRCTIVYGRKKRALLKYLTILPYVDVVYFQKRYSKLDYLLLKFGTIMGKPTVFDLDDAPFGLPGLHNMKRVEESIIRMIKNATAVVVGSQKLLEYAQQYQKQSFYIPSSIKLEEYYPSKAKTSKSSICLGWIGHGKVYRNDLITILQEPLREVASRYKVRLKLIGASRQQELYQAFSNIPGLKTIFIDSLDWANQSEIYREMMDIDIGLYPLIANEYNSYKCGFKALEYMALGLPVVISPVGANRFVVSDTIDGYHARIKEEWVIALSSLIEDQSLRIKMGQSGRHKVETYYNISESAKKIASILYTLKKR